MGEKTTKDNFVCGRVQSKGKVSRPVKERILAQNKCWANELVTKQRGAKERGVESVSEEVEKVSKTQPHHN